jgi:hypothetical protein
MIGIGINENVYLAGSQLKVVEATGQSSLELTFKQVTEGDEGIAELKAAMEANPFADWEDGGSLSYSEGGNSLSIRIFPFDGKPRKDKDQNDVPVDATEMRNRIGAFRDPLVHILSQYMTSDKINMKPSVVFAGTGIDKDINTYGAKIMGEAVQAKVFNNIAQEFLRLIAPFLDNPAQLFRVKFPRQSKKKAFATIPNRFLKENPFMEAMEIPVKASKLKFSAYEISNGLNSAAPISQDTADKVPVEEPENDPFANQ